MPSYRNSVSVTARARQEKQARVPVPPTTTTEAGHYDVLQVGRKATPAVIRRAYRRRALATHPDKAGGRRTEFEKVVTAYETMVTPHLREEYHSSELFRISTDGMRWSDTEPGEPTLQPQGSGVGNEARSADIPESLRSLAVKLWLRTFDVDICETDLVGLSARELTAMVQQWGQINRRRLQGFYNQKYYNLVARERKTQRDVIQTQQIIRHHGHYRVHVTFHGMRIKCQTERLDLEQAVDYLGALTSMLGLARQRVRDSGEDSVPLVEEELVHGLSQHCIPFQFQARTEIRGGAKRACYESPTTSNLQLAVRWWMELKSSKSVQKRWKTVQKLWSKQERESCYNQYVRSTNAEALIMNKLDSLVLVLEEQHKATAQCIADLKADLVAHLNEHSLRLDRVEQGSITDQSQPTVSSPLQRSDSEARRGECLSPSALEALLNEEDMPLRKRPRKRRLEVNHQMSRQLLRPKAKAKGAPKPVSQEKIDRNAEEAEEKAGEEANKEAEEEVGAEVRTNEAEETSAEALGKANKKAETETQQTADEAAKYKFQEEDRDVWYYLYKGKIYEYETCFKGDHCIFKQASYGAEGILLNSGSWWEGDVKVANIRLQLHPDGMLSQTKGYSKSRWDSPIISRGRREKSQ